MTLTICIISYVFPRTDRPTLGTFVLEEAKALKREGNRVIILTGGSNEDKDFEIISELKVYRIKNNTPIIMHYQFYKKILWLNKKYNFNAIHYHFIGLLAFTCNIAAKVIKKPFIITTYGLDAFPRPKYKYLDIILKKIYTYLANKVICYSNYTRELIGTYINKEKLTVINPGVNLDRLRPTKTRKQMIKELKLKNSYIVLSVSNIVRRKGHDIILNSLPRVKKEIPNLIYIVVGEDTGDYKNELDSLIKKLDLEKNVIFVGYKIDRELANYYNLCDIFILMSRTIPEQAGIEGFGVVYIEAAALGKPVIGGKSGGTADAIIDGKTGYRIDPKNNKEISKKIIKLLRNRNLRERLGNYGRGFVKEKLLWKHSVGKLEKIYKSLQKIKK